MTVGLAVTVATPASALEEPPDPRVLVTTGPMVCSVEAPVAAPVAAPVTDPVRAVVFAVVGTVTAVVFAETSPADEQKLVSAAITV